MSKNMKKRCAAVIAAAVLLFALSLSAFADAGNVSGVIKETWTSASTQIKTVVDDVVFPVLDMILAVLFFVKVGSAYLDYRKHGQMEWAGPVILFACLVFSLTAPQYIWKILNM